MKLSPVQDQAIAARMALVVGANTFDRLFAGVQFHEVDGDCSMFSPKTRKLRPKSKTAFPFTFPSLRRAF
jgi:hypothetical protein